MITAERLEELIKQGALIYLVSSIDNEVYSMQLNSYLTINSRYLVDEGGYWYKLDLLFETKERAEWYCKMAAERTEKFDPPMWEDIEEHYTFDWLNKGHHYRLAVDRPHQCIVITDFTIKEDIFDELATKENYEKACEIVRNLFNKGGVK